MYETIFHRRMMLGGVSLGGQERDALDDATAAVLKKAQEVESADKNHPVCELTWKDVADESVAYFLESHTVGQSNVNSITLEWSHFFSLVDHNEVEGIIMDSFFFAVFSSIDLPQGVRMMPTGFASSLDVAVLMDWKERWRPFRKVLFPAHFSWNHWVLYVVDVDVDIEKVTITCYDSLSESRALGKEAEERGKKIGGLMAEALKYSFDGDVTFPDETPLQEKTDCGVFVVVFALCAAFDIPLSRVAQLLSSSEPVLRLRKAIATVILQSASWSAGLKDCVAEIVQRRQVCKDRGLRRRHYRAQYRGQ